MTTATAIVTDTFTCENCRGRGTILDTVQWSDGPGHVDAYCYLCDGKGYLTESPTALALRYKLEAAEAQYALKCTRRTISSFLATFRDKFYGITNRDLSSLRQEANKAPTK